MKRAAIPYFALTMNRWAFTLINCLLLVTSFGKLPATTARLSVTNGRKPVSFAMQTIHPDSMSCAIPFNRAGNLIVVKAKVDTMEGNFVLDTGAPYLVLNITYFRNYPVTTTAHAEQTSITGSNPLQGSTSVKELALGELRYYHVNADLANLGKIENSKGIKILGLLGLELFKQCEMIIDFEKSLIYLHRIGKKESSINKHEHLGDTSLFRTYPIDMVNNRIVTATSIAGKKLKFVVDCAAEASILDSRLPNKIFELVTITGRIKIAGPTDAKADALYGNLSQLQLGGQDFGNLPVMIINLEYTCFNDTNCANGVLGFDFVSRQKIGFNFVKNKMYLWK